MGEIEALAESATTATDDIKSLFESLKTLRGQADEMLKEIAQSKISAASSDTAMAALAAKAATMETGVKAYESKLEEMEHSLESKLARAEGLLLGATSAGLAHAFDERRKTFLPPSKWWGVAFAVSVLGIVALAGTGLWQAYHTDKIPDRGELARIWVSRFPVAGALVWLALHASREAALAKRLEEDYGFKAAISACFEGFRKQMSDIADDVSKDSQLAALCRNTLSTIATPPGRIYESHPLNVSPADELKALGATATEVAKAVKH